MEYEIVEEFDDTPFVEAARSRLWSMQAKPLESVRTAMSLRILDEFGTINIPRSHAPTDSPDHPWTRIRQT